MELDPSIGGRLARYSERRREALLRFEPRAKENLAYQKETLGIALEISGISKDELLRWQPVDGSARSFLEGLPGAQVREDAMLLADFSTLPGFEAIGEVTHYGSKVFETAENPAVRLTVIMANRLPLEQQTGADLIYFNEAYRSFVMVQYKAMEKGKAQAEFRWQVGDQFVQEIARMDALLAELNKIQSGSDPDGYRFSENPFFLKFCPRVVFNPDDKGLFKGIIFRSTSGSGPTQRENSKAPRAAMFSPMRTSGDGSTIRSSSVLSRGLGLGPRSNNPPF